MKIALHRCTAGAAALAFAVLASCAAAAGNAADALPEADRQCLACHAEPALTKTFAHGGALALRVDANAFAVSVHASLGCAACHADVDLAKHPGEHAAFDDARALSVAMAASCTQCHAETAGAYSHSVHGMAQGKEGLAAPLCVGCHGTHDIARATAGERSRDACIACHADAGERHGKWLPNASLHLDVVACAACHAPTAGRRVELRFRDLATKRELVTDGRAIDGASDRHRPLDAKTVRDLVRAIERGGAKGKVVLVGLVEPASAGEGHRILEKAHAVRDCATCHRKGAEPFENVSLSVIGPGGERTLYRAEKDVLHAPTSVESVRAFYAVGGTRIHLLDVVLALALVGGICAPLGHLLLRRLVRRGNERRQSHE